MAFQGVTFFFPLCWHRAAREPSQPKVSPILLLLGQCLQRKSTHI